MKLFCPKWVKKRSTPLRNRSTFPRSIPRLQLEVTKCPSGNLVGGWTTPWNICSRQIGSVPQNLGVKMKHIWNHQHFLLCPFELAEHFEILIKVFFFRNSWHLETRVVSHNFPKFYTPIILPVSAVMVKWWFGLVLRGLEFESATPK